jgi:hypothetical protein
MIRWYKKFMEIDNFQNKLDEYLDIAYAFFMNCYHLKDWIKNDPTIDVSSNTIEEYVNSIECLSICADICNGLKHLKLERPRNDKEPKIEVFPLYDTVLPGERSRRNVFYIGTIDGLRDPRKIAKCCVKSWEKFLRDYELL